MNAVVEHLHSSPAHAPSIWQMPAEEQVAVLQSTLYPGAADQSVRMVLSYCRAADLDPLMKPVHLVPMSVKVARNEWGDDQYETRDVVMPGIGLYRIRAARTGQYAGMDEPEFGPMKTLHYKRRIAEWVQDGGRRKKVWRYEDATLEYPEWCKVVVYRIVCGARCPFPAVEYWRENYATAGRNTEAPNEMWERRPFGQLAKCAEAQALRKAFPEVGAQPTAEEMEGRIIDVDDVRTIDSTATVADSLMPRAKVHEAPAGDGSRNDFGADSSEGAASDAAAASAEAGVGREDGNSPGSTQPAGASTNSKPITEPMLRILRKKAEANGVPEADICKRFGVQALEHLPFQHVNEAMRMAGGAK